MFVLATSMLFHLEYMRLIIIPKFSSLIKNYVKNYPDNYAENIKKYSRDIPYRV
jgi:hypothetical protein